MWTTLTSSTAPSTTSPRPLAPPLGTTARGSQGWPWRWRAPPPPPEGPAQAPYPRCCLPEEGGDGAQGPGAEDGGGAAALSHPGGMGARAAPGPQPPGPGRAGPGGLGPPQPEAGHGQPGR